MGKKTLHILYGSCGMGPNHAGSKPWVAAFKLVQSRLKPAVHSPRHCHCQDKSSHRLVTRHGASLYPASINYSDATSRRQVVEPQLSMVLWFGGSLRWMRKILGNYRLVSSWVSSFCIHFPSDLYYRIRTALSRGVHSVDFIFLYF